MLNKTDLKYRTRFYVGLAMIALFAVIAWNVPKKSLGATDVALGAVNDIYTSFKLEGFGKGWYTQPELDSVDMPNNALAESTNIDMDVKGTIAPRLGTIILGPLSTSTYPIMSLHTARNFQGIEILIRSYDTVLEYYNPYNTTWETLDTGYTSGQRFTFAEGNNSSESNVYDYFSNGTDPIKRFRVTFDSLASNTTSTISLNPIAGYTNAADIGFKSTGGVVMIGGATSSYSGINGWDLTGIGGTATSTTYTANQGVISAVESSGFNSTPSSATALVIKDQRMYAAYQNKVYCSRIDSLQDFSFSAPRKAAEGEIVFFPDEGGIINGLGIKQNLVVVFKNNYIGTLEFKDYSTDLSDIPTVKSLATGINVGATNPNAVANFDYQIYYSSGDIGPSIITNVDNTAIDRTQTMGEILRPSLQNYDFSGSALLFNKHYLYDSAKGSDSTFNDRIIVYDTTYKRFTEWDNLNANAFAVYGNKVYYGDAINKNVYQLYSDAYDDNGNSYTTNFKTKWYNFDEPTRWKEIGWVFVEGFINTATTLKFKINLDEGGNLSTKEVDISGSGAYVATDSSGALSFNPFALINFSNVSGSSSNLKHFVGYINTSDITNKKFRNIQFEGQTSGMGQNYRLTRIIPYYHVLDEQYGRSYSNYIIK